MNVYEKSKIISEFQVEVIDESEDSIMPYIEKGLVVMFDILGFSKLIEEESMMDILGYINNGFAQVVESNSWGTKYQGAIHNKKGDQTGSLIGPDKENLSVNYRYYFDTLIYFTEDTSEESFYKMMVVSAKVLAQMYFYVGLPIRGAISFGELYYDDKNIFGKAIVDAHKYEKNQQWAGVMLSKKLVEKFEQKRIFKRMLEDNLLLEYAVPLKEKDKTSEDYTLNWMQYNGMNWDKNKFEKQWQILRQKKEVHSDDVKQKLKNTIDFREHTINIRINDFKKYNFGTTICI